MNKRILISITLIISLFSLHAQSLKLMTEQNAPFSFTKAGNPEGIAIDLLEEMLKEAGRSESVQNAEYLPWARSYNIIQSTPETVLFPMARTGAREDLFQWVGPIYALQIGLLAKKSTSITIGSSSDFGKYTLGTVREGAPEQLLLGAGADESKLDRVASLEQNLKKLINNRIDALAFNIPSALYNLKLLGENPEDYEVVYVLKDLEIFYGFNKSISNTVIDSLQSAMDQVKKSGKYDQIVAEYLN